MRGQNKLKGRPPGVSSRVRRADGATETWIATNGQAVELPVIVDHVNIDPASGECTWIFEARIDLVGPAPALVNMHLEGNPCLDPVRLQRFFRWASPIEIVRRTIPALLAKGIDPFLFEYATDGYPDAADIERMPTNALSVEFLEEVARQYLDIGRGYAGIIAKQRGVSKRTVVSWVQKARRRGILTPVRKGSRGGRILPKAAR